VLKKRKKSFFYYEVTNLIIIKKINRFHILYIFNFFCHLLWESFVNDVIYWGRVSKFKVFQPEFVEKLRNFGIFLL